MTRRAARVDGNHTEVVSSLRAAGHLVLSLAAVGDGVPDLLVYTSRSRRLLLLEVKDGRRPPSARRLTPDQTAWHALGWPVHVVLSAAEALSVAAIADDQLGAPAPSQINRP